MALLTRARGIALAGATALAVVLPIAPVTPAPTAAAIPAPQAVSVVSYVPAAAPVVAKTRKKRASRGSRSFAYYSARVMKKANSLKGVPYRYGGSTPRGFDCSGYTMYVMRRAAKVSLPHSATAQMRKAKKISRSKAKKGDLVFFRSGSRAYHVGIYAGKNRVLHSPRPGKRVEKVRIWTRNVSFGQVI
ncbi:MAG: C40 family peptidase [Candidatus Nanopelagicales bacterium]